ncbi:MAG: beta-ketoacyl-ACP synthase II [Planctomycetota bacterium]|jgi:3-oxoacyl-[acyl-carrier-protein] synthase II
MRRVAVTGLGSVNPLANNVSVFWNKALAGATGIGPITQFDTTAFKVHFGGEVRDLNPESWLEPKTIRRVDRFVLLALCAGKEAMDDSGIDMGSENPFRCGVIVGSGVGGLNEFEEQYSKYKDKGPDRISPFVIPKMIPNAASGNVSIQFGMKGVNTAVSTACASAAHALTDAMRAIRYGFADVMLAGGAESTITPMGLGGFISAKALSSRNDSPETASRPFDKDRDGFVLSEGAGLLVLEEWERARKRGARIYAEILGAGCTADAYHITSPCGDGEGAGMAMQLALADAGLSPHDINYINAHGTSTQIGDEAETVAIKRVFGEHAKNVPVSSTKSMIGHTLGASGGIEAIVSSLSLFHQKIHPTINLINPDPACDLDYVPNNYRDAKLTRVISNSFGFGGHNACLVFGIAK